MRTPSRPKPSRRGLRKQHKQRCPSSSSNNRRPRLRLRLQLHLERHRLPLSRSSPRALSSSSSSSRPPLPLVPLRRQSLLLLLQQQLPRRACPHSSSSSSSSSSRAPPCQASPTWPPLRSLPAQQSPPVVPARLLLLRQEGQALDFKQRSSSRAAPFSPEPLRLGPSSLRACLLRWAGGADELTALPFAFATLLGAPDTDSFLSSLLPRSLLPRSRSLVNFRREQRVARGAIRPVSPTAVRHRLLLVVTRGGAARWRQGPLSAVEQPEHHRASAAHDEMRSSGHGDPARTPTKMQDHGVRRLKREEAAQ